MTQEDKELLLIDLCARSPYNVKCKVHLDTKGYCLRDEDKYCDDILESVNYKKQTCTFNKSIGYNFGHFAVEDVRPYLRPMSSMTEDEKIQYRELCDEDIRQLTYVQTVHPGLKDKTSCHRSIDWLNKKMFDYRKDDEGKTMIEKGLAIEAPEGIYK